MLSIYRDLQMINFENIRFQTLQSLYSLLFVFKVKLKQFEILQSVEEVLLSIRDVTVYLGFVRNLLSKLNNEN